MSTALKPSPRAIATTLDQAAPGQAAPRQAAARQAVPRKRKTRKPKITCEDCYFHRNLLCALEDAEPCPTFRHHERGLKPPQQLSFVFRQERTRAAWVFEQRND